MKKVVVASLILALGIPTFAVAAGEGRSLLLGKRNPQSGTLTRETEIIANNSTYSTRQSNKRDGDGGGAIYGCRSAPGKEPCLRATNLKSGNAFQFETHGTGTAGSITVGDAAQPPFTTNATGTVANLSADRLDGRDSAEFANTADFLAARVSQTGTLLGGRGATGAALNGGPTTYIVTFNRDVSACTYGVTAVGGNNANKPGASVQAGTNPTNVRVDFDAATGPTPFHLQVIC
jgi:hypothetical protein